MENKSIEQQIKDINDKLDFITEYIEGQQRRQREFQELKDDLTIIGKDIFQTATTELEEVAPHFDTGDLLNLIKKLLRNTRNLTRIMDQVESASDFLKDATPLGKHVVDQLMETLNEMEHKGYFDFTREFVKIFDTVVTTFSVEDVRLFRENVGIILLTLKNLTQPEMLGTVNNALSFFKKMDVQVHEKVGYWEIMKQMRDPELKRGIAFMIQFMKNMVSGNGSGGAIENGNENLKKITLNNSKKED